MKHITPFFMVFILFGCGGTDCHAYSREEIMQIKREAYSSGFQSMQLQVSRELRIVDGRCNFYYDYDSSWRIDSILMLEKLKP